MKWNVYIENVNRNCIEVYNIFQHNGFLSDCAKASAVYGDDRAAFENAVCRSLQYYFWSKCEWEIELGGWPSSERTKTKKVDVYQQVMLNRAPFFDYLWNYTHTLQEIVYPPRRANRR